MAKRNIVEAWLNNVAYAHSPSENTRFHYPYRLKLFCDFIGKTPEQIVATYDTMEDREFRRRFALDVKAFISQMTADKYASCSIDAYVTAVQSFFKYNDLPLGFIPVGRNRVKYHNRDLDKSEIVQILRVSRPRERAYYCMMAQSGLRPDTLSCLQLKHIEPEFSEGVIPCKIDVPEDKTKGEYGAYFTFMCEDSVRYLKSYLLLRRNIGPNDWLFTNEGTNDQSNPKSFSGIFGRTILKLHAQNILQFEDREPGKPRGIRLYNLKKYFRKYAGQAGVEYVNYWMGHKTNYKAPHIPASDEHYFSREDVEFQRRLFTEKAMPNLRLETLTPTESEVKILDLEKQNEELRKTVEVLKPIIDLLGRIPIEQKDSFLQTLCDAKDLTIEANGTTYRYRTSITPSLSSITKSAKGFQLNT